MINIECEVCHKKKNYKSHFDIGLDGWIVFEDCETNELEYVCSDECDKYYGDVIDD